VLSITSCQAPNVDPTCRSVAAWLSAVIEKPVLFVEDCGWQERARRLDEGAVDVAWMCGTWYLKRKDDLGQSLALLAAPVMLGRRYGDRPIYFSDIVVRREAPFASFDDLRGAVWAYNEPDSHSGYHVVRCHLARLGERAGYFGGVVEAGSHQAALALILEGSVDAAAIDSTVLETEFRLRPGLEGRVRTVTTLGPSPMPPWVGRGDLDPVLVRALQQALTHMHESAEGRMILTEAGWARFARVTDADYDPLRAMLRQGEGVNLSAEPRSP